jgi:hypothetical protein
MPLNTKLTTRLEEILMDVTGDPGAGTWKQKRDEILNSFSEEGKSALEEFIAWFEGEKIDV